jgi:hypothetical protein
VTITSVTDSVAPGRRRRLLASSGVDVGLSIATTAGSMSTGVASTLMTLTADTLRAAGLTSCTGLTVAAPSLVQASTSPAPVDAVVALPVTQAEPQPSLLARINSNKSELLGLLTLLLIPIVALGCVVWFLIRRRRAQREQRAAASAAAAADRETKLQASFMAVPLPTPFNTVA